MPVEPAVATEVLVLLHTPPVIASFSVVVLPVFTDAVPVIVPALGNGFTVTIAVAATFPHPLVTV